MYPGKVYSLQAQYKNTVMNVFLQAKLFIFGYYISAAAFYDNHYAKHIIDTAFNLCIL